MDFSSILIKILLLFRIILCLLVRHFNDIISLSPSHQYTDGKLKWGNATPVAERNKICFFNILVFGHQRLKVFFSVWSPGLLKG